VFVAEQTTARRWSLSPWSKQGHPVGCLFGSVPAGILVNTRSPFRDQPDLRGHL
jgi:hypothetical protein